MTKFSMMHIVLRPSRAFTTYNEQEATLASHLGPGTLHHFRALGLIAGVKTDGEWCYSEEEVAQLRRIRRLQHDLGINLAGVEVILHLLAHLEATQRELELEKHKQIDLL